MYVKKQKYKKNNQGFSYSLAQKNISCAITAHICFEHNEIAEILLFNYSVIKFSCCFLFLSFFLAY